jgi:membrane protease YdiL (CAAX protease family)
MDLESQSRQHDTERQNDTEFDVEGDAPVQPIFRFLVAAALTWAANWAVGNLCFRLFAHHLLFADALYRVLTAALLIVLYSLMLRMLDHSRGDSLALPGLPWKRFARRQFLTGLAWGLLAIGLGVVCLAVAGDYKAQFRLTAQALRPSVEVLVLLFGGALLEEVMFRGYPFQRLVEAVGPLWAVGVVSALFGAAHLGNPNARGVLSWAFFNTLAIGVLLAFGYLRSHSLWLPLGIHFGWNLALGFLFGLPVSGITAFSVIVRGSTSGHPWLTGGAYGIEDSALAAALLLMSFPVVFWAGSRFRTPTGATGADGE